MVCHGGAGTTMAALTRGLPTVVVPLFADQMHNASRVAATGAGLVVDTNCTPAGSLSAIPSCSFSQPVTRMI